MPLQALRRDRGEEGEGRGGRTNCIIQHLARSHKLYNNLNKKDLIDSMINLVLKLNYQERIKILKYTVNLRGNTQGRNKLGKKGRG